MTQEKPNTINWSEQDSQTFVDFGRYFVPDRELQVRMICELMPELDQPLSILELCCGEGLLAGALLKQFPSCTLRAIDGSAEMLALAKKNLGQYKPRFKATKCDLLARSWRTKSQLHHAVVSSLALHHLADDEKQRLFWDVRQLLHPSGIFLIADIMQPANKRGIELAAKVWDDAVLNRARELDGNTQAFDYFCENKWNYYRYLDPIDKPSMLFDQLKWLEDAGFVEVDVYWMNGGHALLGGRKAATDEL